MSLLEKIKSDIVESHVWKSIFRHGYEDTPRNRVMMVTSNVFLHLHPVKGAPPCRQDALYLVHGRDDLSDVLDHCGDRRLPDVLLPAGRRVRLRGHEVSGDRHAVRHAHAQHASMGGARA